MPEPYGDSKTVRRILRESGDTWAVVGLSANEERAAYGVARVLQRYGKRIVPVHPKAETVHGEQGYPSLEAVPFPVDVVDVFVNSALAGQVADQAVAAKREGGLVPARRRRRGRLRADPGGGPGDGHGPVSGDRDPGAGVRLSARPAPTPPW